jgi:hypothetical protein
MKTRKQLFILIVLTLLTFSSASFAQGLHVITLNVDTNELNNNNKDAAFSFSVSEGTQVENIDEPEKFTILVQANDDIEWVGSSSSQAAVSIDEIEIVEDETKPDRKKIFRKNKTLGKINNGKKKVKAKVKDKAKGNTYKYIIRFSIGASSFEIDPGLKVGK